MLGAGFLSDVCVVFDSEVDHGCPVKALPNGVLESSSAQVSGLGAIHNPFPPSSFLPRSHYRAWGQWGRLEDWNGLAWGRDGEKGRLGECLRPCLKERSI